MDPSHKRSDRCLKSFHRKLLSWPGGPPQVAKRRRIGAPLGMTARKAFPPEHVPSPVNFRTQVRAVCRRTARDPPGVPPALLISRRECLGCHCRPNETGGCQTAVLGRSRRLHHQFVRMTEARPAHTCLQRRGCECCRTAEGGIHQAETPSRRQSEPQQPQKQRFAMPLLAPARPDRPAGSGEELRAQLPPLPRLTLVPFLSQRMKEHNALPIRFRHLACFVCVLHSASKRAASGSSEVCFR